MPVWGMETPYLGHEKSRPWHGKVHGKGHLGRNTVIRPHQTHGGRAFGGRKPMAGTDVSGDVSLDGRAWIGVGWR